MLSTPTPLPSCTDHGFFSVSKGASKIASTSGTTTTTVVVTKTLQARPPPAPPTALQPSRSLSSGRVQPPPPSSSPPAASDRSSPPTSPPTPPPKRKSPQLEEEVPVGAESEPQRETKRPRVGRGKYKRKSNHWSKPLEPKPLPKENLNLPPPIFRNSRSRSTSSFPSQDSDRPILKRHWRMDQFGDPGCSHLSSETVVKGLMKSYQAYFQNPHDPNDASFEPHPTHYPVAELEYPNSDAVERFILLAPKDKDHYGPITDLEKTLYTMIEYYCTPEQQALFGNPNDWRSEVLSVTTSPPQSPSPSPSIRASSSTSSLHLSSTSVSSSRASSLIRSESGTTVIRAFKRAINNQDGPGFRVALDNVNRLLRSFKYPSPPQDLFETAEPNLMMRTPETWTETGLPKAVLMRIIEETYQRTVGPNVPKLKRYEAFSSTVYGELMPNLIDEVIRTTNLSEDSLFIDLGSGVGNVVVQASLQTGCKSFGIELMNEPARVAEDMVEQMKIRSRMWGIRMGEVELEKGDMLTSKRVDELMPQADVVLVDNKVFEESLNEALKPKFLDLKEGAIVVSLAPFVSSVKARVTERNVDDITAIFDVTEREYSKGSVSWGNSGGVYYFHRVDRTGYAEIRDRFETARQQMRSTRRKAQKA